MKSARGDLFQLRYGEAVSCILLTVLHNIFYSYGDVIIAGEDLQNINLCLALMAFEQGGIFIVPNPNVVQLYALRNFAVSISTDS